MLFFFTGRTGVLIACYLVYSERIGAEEVSTYCTFEGYEFLLDLTTSVKSETPQSLIGVEFSSYSLVFSLPTLTRGKGRNVSTIVMKGVRTILTVTILVL